MATARDCWEDKSQLLAYYYGVTAKCYFAQLFLDILGDIGEITPGDVNCYVGPLPNRRTSGSPTSYRPIRWVESWHHKESEGKGTMSTDSTSWDILGRGWFIESHGIIFRATMLLLAIYCVLVGEYFMDSYSIKSLTAQWFLLKK